MLTSTADIWMPTGFPSTQCAVQYGDAMLDCFPLPASGESCPSVQSMVSESTPPPQSMSTTMGQPQQTDGSQREGTSYSTEIGSLQTSILSANQTSEIRQRQEPPKLQGPTRNALSTGWRVRCGTDRDWQRKRPASNGIHQRCHGTCPCRTSSA